MSLPRSEDIVDTLTVDNKKKKKTKKTPQTQSKPSKFSWSFFICKEDLTCNDSHLLSASPLPLVLCAAHDQLFLGHSSGEKLKKLCRVRVKS